MLYATEEMDGTIDRVARVLWQTTNPGADPSLYDWNCRLPMTGAGFRARWEDMARAAVAAARAPADAAAA